MSEEGRGGSLQVFDGLLFYKNVTGLIQCHWPLRKDAEQKQLRRRGRKIILFRRLVWINHESSRLSIGNKAHHTTEILGVVQELQREEQWYILGEVAALQGSGREHDSPP